MERSPLNRKTPLQRTTPLARGGPLARGEGPKRSGKLKPVSPQQKRVNAQYKAARAEFMADHPICQYPNCTGQATDCHHKRGRGTAPDLRADPDNFAALCSEHHHYVTEHPEHARELGLVIAADFELRRRGSIAE